MPSGLDFTVIIPVFNGAAFLAETIESVRAQSHPAAEIIVIDDGSIDDTLAVAARYGDYLRIIPRERSGVSASRNHGLSVAGTDWVAFIDHDDLWEPNHLENLAKAIAAQPDADVCYSAVRRLVQDPASGTFAPLPPQECPSEKELPAVLIERCCIISTSSVALRRTRALEIGGFDGRYTNCQDWDLWLRLLHAGAHFVHSPEPTLFYRIHAASASHKPLQALKYAREVVKNDILPYMSPIARWTRGQRLISRLEGEAAILVRQNGQPGALALMMRSILRHPFHEQRRYAILGHMLLHGYQVHAPAK